jgi:hypothetical protein
VKKADDLPEKAVTLTGIPTLLSSMDTQRTNSGRITGEGDRVGTWDELLEDYSRPKHKGRE